MDITQDGRIYMIEDELVFRQSGMPLRCSACCKQFKFTENKIQMCECRK